MPEFVEVEAYRRTARTLRGRRIDALRVHDPRLLRRGDEAARVYGIVGGATIERARRIGKVLLLALSSGHSMALTFGLRGRLLVDRTLVGTHGRRRRITPDPRHVRLEAHAGGRTLELEDSLRMATLEIDFDEDRLGVDVLDLGKARLRELLGASGRPVKSLLMDQGKVAGIGNLVADEILFQGRLDPRRPADTVDDDELDVLWRGLRRTRRRVLERGGSHRGVLPRGRDARCPRCRVPVRRAKVGGRTTYFCPHHQR